jgi:hypothetical protein
MGIVVRSKNIWAMRISKNQGIFFVWKGKDSTISVRSWGWTMYDFLDWTDFDRSKEFFNLSLDQIKAVR